MTLRLKMNGLPKPEFYSDSDEVNSYLVFVYYVFEVRVKLLSAFIVL